MMPNDHIPVVRKSIYTKYIKRLLDILLSGAAILILSPLLLIIAVLELIYHGRPILFAQERPGLHGNTFSLYKFRSMTNERDDNGQLLPNEKRLTSFGRLLRRLSLDELPELFCVFIGKMSIIGPRPLHTSYLQYYTPRHSMRHEVRPGFACIPLYPINTWTWNDQFENDIWYIENCSLFVDIRMLFAVAREAIMGSEYRVKGNRGKFTGDNLFADAKGERQ